MKIDMQSKWKRVRQIIREVIKFFHLKYQIIIVRCFELFCKFCAFSIKFYVLAINLIFHHLKIDNKLQSCKKYLFWKTSSFTGEFYNFSLYYVCRAELSWHDEGWVGVWGVNVVTSICHLKYLSEWINSELLTSPGM